ncbi:cAMP-dependent protein kinase type II regulatory subunit-like isoform X2 [Symsagittifera roscoffensis]|uniref:cAMP-dependent protein kinase type II regulatory subunit-like isoform X2 n=1 Tax=Symsagittifera roscoffensis TaxID=84072 RepID=UPI00307B2857
MTRKMVANQGRRFSVSVERVDPSTLDTSAAVVPKTSEQQKRLDQAIAKVESRLFLYSRLSPTQKGDVKAAMFEQRVPRNTDIITQGSQGDYFYVIESGIYEVTIESIDPCAISVGPGGEKGTVGSGVACGAAGCDSSEFKKVNEYQHEGFFGELALLHGDKRAATVTSLTEGTLWAIDRDSFRNIILSHEFRRIWSYEAFLRDVPLMKLLSEEEIWRVADALQPEMYLKGDVIIYQGQKGGNCMYFIEDGQVSVYCRTPTNTVTSNDEEQALGEANCGIEGESTSSTPENRPGEVALKILSRGAYFGEAALVSREARLASVRAESDSVQLCRLDRQAFERLLGPCQNIMARNVEKYREERKRMGVH